MAYHNTNTLPGAVGSARTEDAYDSGRTQGIAPATGLGLGQSEPHGALKGGLAGAAGVCDAPGVYNSAIASKQVEYVEAGGKDRTYEAPRVEETVVVHEVERVQPVLHQEVHQTRLHEVTHHKVAPVKDLGVVEVVHHRDTDECGNVITGSLNAVRGTGTGLGGVGHHQHGEHAQHGGVVENIKEKITGHHGNQATTGTDNYTTGTGSGLASGLTGHVNTAATYPPTTALPGQYDTGLTGTHTGTTGLTGTHTGTTGTGLAGTHATTTHAEPGGIKGLINKVIPGPGPFKA